MRAFDDPLLQGEEKVLDDLIYVAPDVDQPLFEQRLGRVLHHAARITSYFSRHDLALRLSGRVFEGPRQGAAPVTSDESPLDLIDASAIKADLLGHAYHEHATELHQDLRELLELKSPDQRRLLIRDEAEPRLWRLRPGLMR